MSPLLVRAVARRAGPHPRRDGGRGGATRAGRLLCVRRGVSAGGVWHTWGLQCVLPGDTSEPLGPAGVRVLQPLGMCLKSCRQPGREGHGGAGPAGGGVAAPQTTGGQRPWHRAAPGWAPTCRPWPTMALAPPPPSGRKPGCWQRGQPSGTRKGPAAMSPSSPRGSALYTSTSPEVRVLLRKVGTGTRRSPPRTFAARCPGGSWENAE